MSRFLTKILNDKPGEKPKFEVVQKSETASQTQIGQIKELSTPPPTPTPILSASPEKNFTKVANSIKPEMFRGTSQKTYMVLYKLTRGAIVPKRTVKITRNDLMAYADVSETTLVKHITYLEKVANLIKKTAVKGDNDGATYEVIVPEEIGAPPPPPTPPPTSIQKVGGPSRYNVGVGGGGYSTENKATYGFTKTSLKTNTNDDDEKAAAFSEVVEKFNSVSCKLTGRGISKREAEKWNDFADLIILELEIAASRSDGISSVPAFLTEVLRRQFFTSHQQKSPTKSNKTKIDTVGNSESDSYEIKPLDAKERETAFEQLREFAGDDFLHNFKKWYTPVDWNWLIKRLETESEKL
jgi:hypothetical protein